MQDENSIRIESEYQQYYSTVNSLKDNLHIKKIERVAKRALIFHAIAQGEPVLTTTAVYVSSSLVGLSKSSRM